MFSVILTQNIKFKATNLPYNKHIWVNVLYHFKCEGHSCTLWTMT